MGCALYYLCVGVFLIWQFLGYNGVTVRLVISKLNQNIFFFVASSVVCKFAILLGIISVLMGIFQVFNHRSVLKSENNDKLGKSDWTLAVFFAIFAVATIL